MSKTNRHKTLENTNLFIIPSISREEWKKLKNKKQKSSNAPQMSFPSIEQPSHSLKKSEEEWSQSNISKHEKQENSIISLSSAYKYGLANHPTSIS
jgi:hypothetical protein